MWRGGMADNPVGREADFTQARGTTSFHGSGSCPGLGTALKYASLGRVPKRSQRHRLEIGWGLNAPRGFESHPFRQTQKVPTGAFSVSAPAVEELLQQGPALLRQHAPRHLQPVVEGRRLHQVE